MAIDRSLYTEKLDVGLKADKDFIFFYYRFKVGKSDIIKTFDFEKKPWDKKERKKQAKLFALTYKAEKINNIENITGDFSENSTLNEVAGFYFSKKCDTTSEWTAHRKRVYELYIEDTLGKQKVVNIKMHHIDDLQNLMKQKGHSKQTLNGCSLRTIKKVLLQTLKPILIYAKDNKIISDIPKIEIVKLSKEKSTKKKKVSDAGAKFVSLYKTIIDLYKENPFYRALFLFALFGRRWNEIRTLQWSDIDFLDNTYTIREENNKIGENQTYDLSSLICDALQKIEDDNFGLVFKSPVTGKELYTPKKQLAHIREASNIPELTMHYFRHILVSAMGETGVANTLLSASLGHTNLNTVNDYYLSVNHTKATRETNVLIGNMLSNENNKTEVIE